MFVQDLNYLSLVKVNIQGVKKVWKHLTNYWDFVRCSSHLLVFGTFFKLGARPVEDSVNNSSESLS